MSYFFNEETEAVALQFANVETLYFPLREEVEMVVANISCRAQRIEAIADYIEVEARDWYLSGTETPAGDDVIRSFLNRVHWDHLGRLSYEEFEEEFA